MNRKDIEKAQRDGTHLAAKLHGDYSPASEVTVTGFHETKPAAWSSRKNPVRYWHLEVVSDPYDFNPWPTGHSVPRNEARSILGTWTEYKSQQDAQIAEDERQQAVRAVRDLDNEANRAELRDLLDVHLPEPLRPHIGDYDTAITLDHAKFIKILRFLTNKEN